jgi:hypothetical protein
MKTLQVETESFHADGQANMTQVTVALRKFANAPKHCDVSAAIFISGTQKWSLVKITFTTHLEVD